MIGEHKTGADPTGGEEVEYKGWDRLSREEKIHFAVHKMANPKFFRKGGEASGADSLMVKISQESGLADDILASPGGREAVLAFTKALYRSENGSHSWSGGEEMQKVFDLSPNAQEETSIRDAKLDCIANAIGNIGADLGNWTEGLSDDELKTVAVRAVRKGAENGTPVYHLVTIAKELNALDVSYKIIKGALIKEIKTSPEIAVKDIENWPAKDIDDEYWGRLIQDPDVKAVFQ